uniref:MAM domain-containing protein n=1 Tax=Echeneis naucrates TaxID=173247 RepID=A0A665X458_ECHNA
MLDDISFDSCGEGDVPAGADQLSCDFEKDTCSWYNDYTASILWKVTDGKCTRCPTGNAASDLNISSAARLIGFSQPEGQVTCVSFWYHIFGNSIGSLKFITKHPDEAETVVWMRKGTQGNKWRFADLTFSGDKPIQVFLLFSVVGGKQGTIAIDDIVVSSPASGSCAPERECTFQGSLCGLQPSGDFSWHRITGMSQPANSSGPTADHTLGSQQGAMMTAVMNPTPSDGECLMFWYYMEGSGVGELSIYIQTPESHRNPQKLWERSGDQGTHWRHGRVTLLSPDNQYQVGIHFYGSKFSGFIAIDDIKVKEGACSNQDVCGFESNLCDFENALDHKGQWYRRKGTKHHVDHTYGTENGEWEIVVALFVYLLYLFRYWLAEGSSNDLAVHLLRSGDESAALWKRSGASSKGWEVAEVTVSSPAKFRVRNGILHFFVMTLRHSQMLLLPKLMYLTRWRLQRSTCQAPILQ